MTARTPQPGTAGAVVVAVIAGLLLTSNWAAVTAALPSLPTFGRTPAPTVSAWQSPTGIQLEATRQKLDALQVIPRPKRDPNYRRAMFGKAWADTDGNGCNQRDDVLLRDVDRSKRWRVGVQGRCRHDMLAGTWNDPYTGTSITLTNAKAQDQAQRVQVDHIVPLAAAFRYGANGWSDARRLKFATDLNNLVAVSGSANTSKGDQDPAAWRPRKAAQCGYAVRYIAVKAKYALPTDTSEKAALASMLATCG